MRKSTEKDATHQKVVEMLETALAEYAVKYGLTDNAREALRFSLANTPSNSSDLIE